MTVSRLLALICAVLILLGSGMMYQSFATDSEQLDVAVSRLPHVPLEIGDWKAQPVPENEADEVAFERAGAKGYWMRTYVHQRTRHSVLVLLMCGRSGKMAVHTPEICYRGAGFELSEPPAVAAVKNPLGEEMGRFWTGQFAKKPGKASLRLYWGWNGNGPWEASASPRFQYRGQPYLYKLYASGDSTNGSNVSAQVDPALDLLRQLLPELTGSLFPTNKGI